MTLEPTKRSYRPKRLSRFIRREVAGQLAPAVIEWMARQPVIPDEERELPNPPPPEAIPGILEDVLYNRDGYEIARHLQLIHFIQPDSELVAILAPTPELLQAAFARAWQQWLADTGLGPLPIGSKALFKHYLALCPGEVVSNDEAAGESRLIFPDRRGGDPEHPGIPYRWEHLQPV